MSFHILLNDIMKAYGVSNVKLAEEVGVSESAVKKWRKGTASPTLDNVDKIADFFQVSIDELSGNSRTSKDVRIPVIGTIRAGYPVESFDAPEGYVSMPTGTKVPGNLFALKVAGDSMLPLVMEGDVIILDKNTEKANGKICAVTVDDESTLKRVKIDSTGVTLVPTNPLYKELSFY